MIFRFFSNTFGAPTATVSAIKHDTAKNMTFSTSGEREKAELTEISTKRKVTEERKKLAL